MRVVIDRPPNYAAIAAALDLTGKRPIFCYGDTIYNPSAIAIDEPLFAHECRHSEQQADTGPAAWWERYLADPAFRLAQEADAYGAQLAQFGSLGSNRHQRRAFAVGLAEALSSSLYGRLIGRQRALAMIVAHS